MKIINITFLVFIYFFPNQSFALLNEGKCIYAKGSVYFERAGVKEILVANTIIKENDMIIVSPKSLAIIKFKYQTLKIQETSKIQVTTLKENYAKFSLENGSVVINQLKKKLRESVRDKAPLEVKTASATMGIRGTTFFVYQGGEGQTVLSVQEGKVDFLAKNSIKEILVSGDNSSMTNEDLKNLRPRSFGFEKEINFNMDPEKKLESGEGLKSALEASWKKYKSEQEVVWNDKKINEESEWDNWKKLNN